MLAPRKTALGYDELRHRTHGLSQRHRTVLLLVDGRRSMDMLLDMADQAGACASHFDELVQRGLVALSESQRPDSAATLLAPQRNMVADPPRGDTAHSRPPQTGRAAGEASPTVGDDAAPDRLADEHPPGAESSPASPAPKVDENLKFSADSTCSRARDSSTVLSMLPRWLTAIVRSDAEMTISPDEPCVQEVRTLLTHALGADALLLAPLTLSRVRTARTAKELIAEVWEIEHHRGHLRRGHSQLLDLQRARELLGMGNTQVNENSPTTQWPDTVSPERAAS